MQQLLFHWRILVIFEDHLKYQWLIMINCEVELKLKWTKHCALATGVADPNNIVFTIKNTKLYAHKLYVVTLSVKDN